MGIRATGIAAVLAFVWAAGPAAAQDVAPGVQAEELTALSGVVVWSSRAGTSMVAPGRSPQPVPGAPVASRLDLGRDRRGRLILTYLSCPAAGTGCYAAQTDLRGRHTRYRGLTLPGCSVASAPAVWGPWTAYALRCRSAERTGVYAKRPGEAPRRLRLPSAVGPDPIGLNRVDLRGGTVAALAADTGSVAFTQTLSGRRLRSELVAVTEGDTEDRAHAMALTADGMYVLKTTSTPAPAFMQSIVRLGAGACRQTEGVRGDTAPPFTALAADDDGLVVAQSSGIARRAFAPANGC